MGLLLAAWLKYLWRERLPRSLFAVLVLPQFVSATALGLIGRFMFHDQVGMATRWLRYLGMLGDSQAPLGTATGHGSHWGFWMRGNGPVPGLLFWLAFGQIRKRQLEVSRIDGLSATARLRFVIWPQIRSSVQIIVVVRLLEAFRAFDLIQTLTGVVPV